MTLNDLIFYINNLLMYFKQLISLYNI